MRKQKESLVMEWEERSEGDKGIGEGGAKRMGEGLFVHALNSLGVISIACSIIVPFDKKKKNTAPVELPLQS